MVKTVVRGTPNYHQKQKEKSMRLIKMNTECFRNWMFIAKFIIKPIKICESLLNLRQIKPTNTPRRY